MIHTQTLTPQWLEEISAQHRKADKILIEKAIRALFLLEGLANSNLHFVFKGGTALMLTLLTEKLARNEIKCTFWKFHAASF